MRDRLAEVLARDPRLAYAVLFGSQARGTARPDSDVDVAIGLRPGVRLGALDLGGLVADLSAAVGRDVDVVVLDEAPPALAYRVFKDGVELHVADRGALVSRRARAIVAYLDFKPIEERCTAGVLAAAARGR